MTFNPFAQFTKVYETWQKMADDSVARTNAFFGEVEKAEAKRVAQTESVIEEMAKMQKDSLAYGAQLAAEWRKITVESIQKAGSFANSANGAS